MLVLQVIVIQTLFAAPPTVRITSPTLDSSFPANHYVEFRGFATDDQGREIAISSLVWTSNIDGQLAYGRRSFAVLSPGYHTIRLTARDNAGTTAAATTLIRVGVCDSPVARKITTTADISDFLLDEKRGNVIVINRAANRVEFYNIATGALAGVVPVGSNPMDGDLTLDGNQLLVANYNSTFVSIVDLNTQTVIGTIPAAEGRRPRQILAMTNSLAFLYTAAEAIGSPPWGGTWQIANLLTRTAVMFQREDVAVTQHNWHAGPGPYVYESADGFSPGGIRLSQVTTNSITMIASLIEYYFPEGPQKLASNLQGTRIVLGGKLCTRTFQLIGDLGLSLDYFKCFDRTGRHV
jgi:YVTN family beta-propeller protein